MEMSFQPFAFSSLMFGPLSDNGRKKNGCCDKTVVYNFSWGAFQRVSFLPTFTYQQFQKFSLMLVLSSSCPLSSWGQDPCLPHASEPSLEPVRFWAVHSLAFLWCPTCLLPCPHPAAAADARASLQKTKNSGHASVESPP